MKKFYLLKLGKSPIILDTTKGLYKYTRAPRQANTRPGKRRQQVFQMLGSYFQPPASGDAVSLVRKGSWS